MPTVKIAFDLPLNRLFDYEAPQATEDDIGRRVLAPFGTGEKTGVIMGVGHPPEVPSHQLRAISTLWRDLPPLSHDDLRLLRFCSDYYHHPLGAVVLNALPPALRKKTPWSPPRRRKPLPEVPVEAAPALNSAQQEAIDAVLSRVGHFDAYLLFGITGSGKTEVYLQLIRALVSQGFQALILTPEINLTPQLEMRFRQRLHGVPLVCMHSALGEKERAVRWLAAQNGEAAVVLGTRSTVFCPMPKLGLIVVDEEHDTSYKQQEGLRYSARDVALVRAQQRQVPILLGTATPALETWWNAESGKYRLLTLPQRAIAGATLPRMQLIEFPGGGASREISGPVTEAIRQRLERHEQSLIFINRRGFAPVLFCSQCHWLSGCPHCAAKMVVHLRAKQLRCHHCGGTQPIPDRCPDCGNTHLDLLGAGTQKVEEELRQDFPEARILRLDRDTLSRQDAWRDTLASIQSGEVDILIGTQLLAKGHDFPNITLVAALGVDGALYASDFRSGERLFSQMVQVGGRAGRGLQSGEVLIQTAFPQHPLFAALRVQDYPRFAELALAERQLTMFPPFTYLAMLRAASENTLQLEHFMAQAAGAARRLADGVEIYDPVPATLARVAGKVRWQLLVQSTHRQSLQAFLKAWQPYLQAMVPSRVQWTIDVDPTEL